MRAAHAALAMAVGIAVAGTGPVGVWAAAAIGLGMIAIGALGPARARVAWLAAIACAGAAIARTSSPSPVKGADDRVDDTIEGVIDGPIERGPGGDYVMISIEGGRVGAWVAPGAWSPGDRVRATGRLMTPRGFRDPGAIDREQVARDRGVDAELVSASMVRAGSERSWWAWPVAAQRWGSAFVRDRGGDAEANAIVRGAVLGDRSAIGPSTDAAWRAAGVYHVLSVSGLHLAVVALLAFAGLRRGLVLWMSSRRAVIAAAIVAGILAMAYTAMTGAQVATERALVVVIVMIAGAASGRRARLADALGVAAIAILAARPSALGDPSFQLSFAAAMTLATTPVRPERSRGARRIVGWIVRGVIASATVTAVTAPITAAHFHQVSLGGVVGNLIVTPLVELVAIPLALVGVALHLGPLVDLAILACRLGDAIARAIASVMPSAAAPPLPAVAIVAWLGAIALLIAAARAAIAPVRAAAGAMLSTAIVALAVIVARAPRGDLRVTFLDVGQGDAAVIEAPGGEIWLVDAGPEGETLVRYLAARGIDHIDVAIISHPHPDHYSGLYALAGRVPIGELWSASEDEPLVPAPFSFAAAERALEAYGTRVVHPPLGLARSARGAALVVLAPITDLGDGPSPIATADPVRSVNDDSLVVAIEYAGRRIVLTGDLEAEGEAELVAHHFDLAADVVKVPHHGSPTSSSPALVGATRPSTAIISCGVANRFGFPSPAVVARWQAAGAQVLRTDRRGAVTVEVHPDGRLDTSTYDML
ncbi:MAG TPA: DNA internalization-related competence protein ComEC/Rec2 [Kofleriaceae bacterium]|nr:DNA internalization-related competence protein ComEC/Rec2 [Kofleriaceae bacterium]